MVSVSAFGSLTATTSTSEAGRARSTVRMSGPFGQAVDAHAYRHGSPPDLVAPARLGTGCVRSHPALSMWSSRRWK